MQVNKGEMTTLDFDCGQQIQHHDLLMDPCSKKFPNLIQNQTIMVIKGMYLIMYN